MKKIIFLSCLLGLLSLGSLYAGCTDGTWINATSGTFCKSNSVMQNWWSAYNWCKANEMNLATVYEMCPSWNGKISSGNCPELKGTKTSSNDYDFVWSSTAYNDKYAYYVSLGPGTLVYTGEPVRYRTYSGAYAFCR